MIHYLVLYIYVALAPVIVSFFIMYFKFVYFN